MSQCKRRLQSKIKPFLRGYGRSKQPGHDPNDRHYDRKLQKKLKKLDPIELDKLMHGEYDERL